MPTTSEQRIQSASAQRRERARLELRQNILDAASELLLEQGYEDFSLRQVAERIGYTPTTIYLHFASKEDLILALLDEAYARFGEQLAGAIPPGQTPLEQVRAAGRGYIEFGLRNPVYYQLMFMRRLDVIWERMMARSPQQIPEHIDGLQAFQALVARAVQTGALQPIDPQILTLSLWSVVHGLTAMLITAPALPQELTQPLIEQTLSAVLNGYRAS